MPAAQARHPTTAAGWGARNTPCDDSRWNASESLSTGWKRTLEASLRDIPYLVKLGLWIISGFPLCARIPAMNSLEISSRQFRALATEITKIAAEYLESLDGRNIAPSTTGKKSMDLF